MQTVLFLNEEYYPNAFDSIEIDCGPKRTKITHVEKSILKRINDYNPKLNVAEIEYISIGKLFNEYKTTNFNGVIAEKKKISTQDEEYYRSIDYTISVIGSDIYAYRIVQYVFISSAQGGGRNTFISQIVFPSLLEYAADYIEAPNYTLANHGFIFINILGNALFAKTILRNIALLVLMGIDYIEVFADSIDVEEIPLDIKRFLSDYDGRFVDQFDSKKNVYYGPYYEIDFSSKRLTWRTKKLIDELKKSEKAVDFNGSSEKFFWMETLPITIYAYRVGYEIEFSEYEAFVGDYENRFSKNSDKFRRCKTLLAYLEKCYA